MDINIIYAVQNLPVLYTNEELCVAAYARVFNAFGLDADASDDRRIRVYPRNSSDQRANIRLRFPFSNLSTLYLFSKTLRSYV